jgi:hypothetical protein
MPISILLSSTVNILSPVLLHTTRHVLPPPTTIFFLFFLSFFLPFTFFTSRVSLLHYSACVHVVHILNTQYYLSQRPHLFTHVRSIDHSHDHSSFRSLLSLPAPHNPGFFFSLIIVLWSLTAFKKGQIGDRSVVSIKHPQFFYLHLEIQPRPGLSARHHTTCASTTYVSYTNPCPRAMSLIVGKMETRLDVAQWAGA